MSSNYEDIWELVNSNIDIAREEFENLVERVYEKSKGMVTKRAAAIIVARELGVDTSVLMYPPIRGRILDVGPVKYSSSASGETPYVLFTLVNEDAKYLCVAFGEDHISTLKELEDKPVEIKNYTRVKLTKYTMIKVTEKSEIIPLDEDTLPPIHMLKPAIANNIREIMDKPGSSIIKAVVIDEQVSEYFTCPECGRSLDLVDSDWVCPIHGSVEPVIKKVYRLLISDPSGEYPAVYFGSLDMPSLLNKLIIFKGFGRNGEVQINKIYEVSKEDFVSL